MKKILVLLVLLAGAAGAAVYFSRSPDLVAHPNYYADYLPADTLATVSLLDLNGLTDTFPASAVGQLLAKTTVHDILTELGADPADSTGYDEVYDGVVGVVTNPAFRQVFGDDAVVALLAPDSARLRTDPGDELQQSLLVFATSAASGPLDSFARLVMSKSVSRETVAGLEITRIQLDEEVIYGYAENGILVLAWNPSNIVVAVGRKQAGGGLRTSDFFAAAEHFWSGFSGGRQYARSYVNIARLRPLLSGSKEKSARDAADFLQGLKVMQSIIVQTGNELRITSRLEYDFASLNGILKHQYQALSEKNLSLGLLTRQALAYYWSCTFDQAFVKEMFSAGEEEQYTKLDAEVRRELGMSLEEIIGAVGPQSGLVVKEIVNVGLFPLPRVIFFLQVRDHAIALKVLDRVRKKIAERGFAAEQSEQVNNQVIYYWSVLPGEATQPALVLTDTMLYIANGKSSLEPLIAGDMSLDMLPADMAATLGPELVENIEAGNYSTFVMRPARLADEVKEALDWLSGMLSAANGVSTGKLKEAVLKAMHSIEIVVATSDLQEDHADSVLVFKAAVSAEKKNQTSQKNK